MKAAIQQRARELGFDACSFTTATPPDHSAAFTRWIDAKHHGEMAWLERNAHKRIDPQQVLASAKTIVTLAVSYARATKDIADQNAGANSPAPPFSGVVARYAQFSDYHDILAERLKCLTDFVNQLDGGTTQSLWYVDTGPLLERDLAQRSGLGFVGKHTNLISRDLGNWIFLSEIITTLELEPDAPEKNRCGNCTRCITACPTEAIRAPFELDARRCISYLTIELKGAIPLEFRSAIGNRIYGCDDCLAACPWNRFAREGNLMKAHERHDLDTPDLLELLSLDDAAFKKRFAGSPILRTKRRGFLRNVCVALGNIGDERVLPALQKATADHEPLIAEHAQWAIEQIQQRIPA
ncbi:MAG: tRNA epoxyqueuosine(34) reductase QueG [Verrucomicrobiales bacterium]|nr:tRNA epoxyqueuosine(34) reductase QueG [Verrucomicrobiales bacterium]